MMLYPQKKKYITLDFCNLYIHKKKKIEGG